MIILTNCLTETADEGAVKVVNSLIKRIKKQKENVRIISYERKTRYSDWHINLNKLMINPRFLCYMHHSNEDVLYMPFPARMLPIFVRVFVLSLCVRKRLKVLLTMQGPIGCFSKFLLKICKAEIFSISRDSWSKCAEIIGPRAKHIKVGVDTQKFVPISDEVKKELRRKYNLPEDKIVVLHVGHMKEGRNIQQTLKLDKEIFVLLVTSTSTKNEQDCALKCRLEQCENVRIIDSFVPNIEEIYQLADVYFFPVESNRHCIDAPLSVFEAAACNISVVHTEFGELVAFLDKEGFYPIYSFDAENLNRLVHAAVVDGKNPRSSILEYDWDKAVESICQ